MVTLPLTRILVVLAVAGMVVKFQIIITAEAVEALDILKDMKDVILHIIAINKTLNTTKMVLLH